MNRAFFEVFSCICVYSKNSCSFPSNSFTLMSPWVRTFCPETEVIPSTSNSLFRNFQNSSDSKMCTVFLCGKCNELQEKKLLKFYESKRPVMVAQQNAPGPHLWVVSRLCRCPEAASGWDLEVPLRAVLTSTDGSVAASVQSDSVQRATETTHLAAARHPHRPG